MLTIHLQRIGITACLMLAGCASTDPAQQELAELCRSATPFRLPLQKTSAADEKISERFSSACYHINRIEGLQFKEAERVYLCTATAYRNPNDPRVAPELARQEKAFGRKLRIEDFDRSAGEPDDIRERMNRQRSPRDLTHLPLGGSTGFAGVYGKFLLLTDSEGNLQKILYTYDDFDRSIREISSLSGAMILLELKNIAGFGPAIEGQCRTGKLRFDGKAWTAEAMEVPRNCAKPVMRDVRIEKNGSVHLLRQYAWPNDKPVAFICAD